MFSVVRLVVLFAALVVIDGDYFEKRKCRFERLGLSEALEALERGTNFFEKYYKLMNVDGIFGLRSAEGILHSIIHRVDRSTIGYKGLHLYYKIRAIQKKLGEIGDNSLPYLKRQKPAYFNKFRPIVKQRFAFSRRYRRADMSTYFKNSPPSLLNETMSDICMSAMMGTSANGISGHKCQISDYCMEMMGNSSGRGYVSTHQALFLMLGVFQGCKDVAVKKYGGLDKLEHRLDVLGSNIYADMLGTANNIGLNRDLFMEQNMVCFYLGIVDCMKLGWLEKAVSWQGAGGGFSPPSDGPTHTPWLAKKLAGAIDTDYSDNKRYHSRSLKEDVTLPGGRSAHTSGIGLSVAASYLHWLVLPPDYNALGMKSPLPVSDCTMGTTHHKPS